VNRVLQAGRQHEGSKGEEPAAHGRQEVTKFDTGFLGNLDQFTGSREEFPLRKGFQADRRRDNPKQSRPVANSANDVGSGTLAVLENWKFGPIRPLPAVTVVGTENRSLDLLRADPVTVIRDDIVTVAGTV
jgi:hypothetical protein